MYVCICFSERPQTGLESELCVYNYCSWYIHTNNPIHVQVKVCFQHSPLLVYIHTYACAFAIGTMCSHIYICCIHERW